MSDSGRGDGKKPSEGTAPKPSASDPKPRVVKGDQNFQLDRDEFRRRLLERFFDPGFEQVADHLEKVVDVAWDAYMGYRKNPRVRKAGSEFADPEQNLPIE